MAQVICTMADCVHRSKRPMKKWRFNSGAPCYGCLLETAMVTRIFDADGDIEAKIGAGNMAQCKDYEPLQQKEESREE